MLEAVMGKVYFDNTVAEYAVCICLFLAGLIVLRVLKAVVFNYLKKWAAKTETTVDDFIISLIGSVVLPFLYFSVLFLSLKVLALDPGIKKVLDTVWMALLTLSAIRILSAFIKYSLDLYWSRMGKQEALKRSLNGILVISRVVIWGMAVIFFLDNLGFKISAVIAGLGIGGVAVALAAQAVLGDLFSYFAILFDRPFEIGDFVIIGDFMGTVEHVGVKTTRIRSLGGEQLIFSNTDLTNSRVRNYKRMEKRRVVFHLGVTYQTPLEKLKTIPGIIESAVKNAKDTVFDRAHFYSYGDFSLIFEVVYYVNGPDYNKYMDIQQEINLTLKKEFDSRGIEFAYPTQTVFVAKQ